MSRPRISEEAEADLNEIWLYIGRENVQAANRLLDELYYAMSMLNRMPKLGHVRGRPGR